MGKWNRPIEERLRERIVIYGECWRWTGSHTTQGYGNIKIDGRARGVHLVAFEEWVGPIPIDCEIDHVRAAGCVWRDCVNPAHLEAVTASENCRRRHLASRRRTDLIHVHNDLQTRYVFVNGSVCRDCTRPRKNLMLTTESKAA